MAARPGMAPQAPLAGQAGSSTAGSFALVLCWAARLITVEHYAEPSSSRMGLHGPARPLGW
jgi:hypothetical protein